MGTQNSRGVVLLAILAKRLEILAVHAVLEPGRHIFESIVEKVIVGGYDSDGNKDPYMIVFVYKTGFICFTCAI